MEQTDGSGNDQLLTLAQAVREANGKISYQQLWKAIRAGRVDAYQPSGPGGTYKILRADFQRFLQPVRPQAEK